VKSTRVELESDDGKDENGEHDQKANLEDSNSTAKVVWQMSDKKLDCFANFFSFQNGLAFFTVATKLGW